jgi:AraC-like DNA-binding protein
MMTSLQPTISNFQQLGYKSNQMIESRIAINASLNNIHDKQNSVERLTESLELLTNIELNISEIAYTIGYNDPKYFTRCFRRTFGITPKEFRKQYILNKENATELYADTKFLNKVDAKIQENLSNLSFGVDELADQLCVSYSTLYRKIKIAVGISPCELIRKTRIKNAVKMMNHKMVAFNDIAFAAGFSNYSYFSRCFKSEFGLLPSEYIHKL